MMITSQASERLVWCDFIGGESEGSLRLVSFFWYRQFGTDSLCRLPQCTLQDYLLSDSPTYRVLSCSSLQFSD